MPPTSPRFIQDDTGQWWYTAAGSVRIRAFGRKCERCSQDFLYSAAHKQQRFCSRRCGYLAQHVGDLPAADASATRAPTSKRYYQDEGGDWWYRMSAGQRTRCKAKQCEQCGVTYPVYVGYAAKSRFCSRACSGVSRQGPDDFHRAERSSRWNGGIIKRRGYVLVYMPEHHSIAGRGTQRKYVLEHRLVMEEKLGRPLLPREQVHHINGVKDDNRPENLELWRGSHPSGVRTSDTEKHCPTCTCRAP